MNRTTLLCLFAGLLFAGDTGIRPRGDSVDYPGHASAGGVSVGAAGIAPKEVAKLFATDLNRAGYVVVEVAVYPDGRDLDLQTRDFMLRIGSDTTTIRPSSAQTIAGILGKKYAPPKPKLPGNVSVYTGTTVGYETGTYNGQRRGGVYTESTVGVGVGDPGPVGTPPPPPGRDATTIEQELSSGALPEGKTTQTVAGYLYFARPSGVKLPATLHLTYYGAESQIRVEIPPSK